MERETDVWICDGRSANASVEATRRPSFAMGQPELAPLTGIYDSQAKQSDLDKLGIRTQIAVGFRSRRPRQG